MGAQIIQRPSFQRPSGGLYLSADQLNLTGSNWNNINIDTIKTGFIDGIENTGTYRITPGVAGFYLIIAQVHFKNIVADSYYSIRVCKDAVQIIESINHAALVSSITVRAQDVIKLTSIDILKLMANPGVGVNTVDVEGGSEYETFLTVQRVR